jgi:hypothetical protein
MKVEILIDSINAINYPNVIYKKCVLVHTSNMYEFSDHADGEGMGIRNSLVAKENAYETCEYHHL